MDPGTLPENVELIRQIDDNRASLYACRLREAGERSGDVTIVSSDPPRTAPPRKGQPATADLLALTRLES